MSENTSAVDVAVAYFNAWTSNDIETAMSLVADDIVSDAPNGHYEGAAEFRPFIENFAPMIEGASLLAAFGDEERALVMYELQTAPVKDWPCAEYVNVRDGRIATSRVVFDQTPMLKAGRALLSLRPATTSE